MLDWKALKKTGALHMRAHHKVLAGAEWVGGGRALAGNRWRVHAALRSFGKHTTHPHLAPPPPPPQGQLALQPVSIVFANSWTLPQLPPPSSYNTPQVRRRGWGGGGHAAAPESERIGMVGWWVAACFASKLTHAPLQLLWVDYFVTRADQDSASVRSLHLLEASACGRCGGLAAAHTPFAVRRAVLSPPA